MAKRYRLSRRRSSRNFRRGGRVNKLNLTAYMRGGTRL